MMYGSELPSQIVRILHIHRRKGNGGRQKGRRAVYTYVSTTKCACIIQHSPTLTDWLT